mmetsp:Transcript_29659/g.65710  ORF Transcript_29659/g.65710 Transcript_29659/m.65710 type:complete len:477 (+) Transcript_29659:145-1575(+)
MSSATPDTYAATGSSSSAATPSLLNVLVVTLEFTYSPFSGNGMYGRSVVRSLLRTDQCRVSVICARPRRRDNSYAVIPRSISSDLSSDHHIVDPEITREQACRLNLWPVDLPPGASWKKLDEHGPWEDFASGAARRYVDRILSEWIPDVILVVDWHGGAAWRSIADIARERRQTLTLPPVCYFNFRVYASGLCPTKADWYERKEQEALEIASDIVCLSRPDMKSLQGLLPPRLKDEGKVNVNLIHPALRGDMHSLAECFQQFQPRAQDVIRTSLHPAAAAALGSDAPTRSHNRRFITCAVRLSKEKNPIIFVEVMRKMSDAIRELGLIPLLCGAASDEEYAAECRAILRQSHPNAVIIDEFLGPEELASIFAHSVINFHPCRYDAFGMTAVEAAAFGAPALINCRDVGAAELLGDNGCITVDMDLSRNELVSGIESVLFDNDRLETIRKEAYGRAMSWSEDASGKVILDRLKKLVV